MTSYTEWTPDAASACIAVPRVDDDKYTRGVLGVMTGSAMYPGAAVLGVEAALHTGVGMVRYAGEARELVLHRRPEVVTADGRVQAWLLGSGIDHIERQLEPLLTALVQGVPTILDGGALDLHDRATGSVVITPHHGELARVLGITRAKVSADPAGFARRTADELGVTVLLKGHTTYVCGPDHALTVTSPTTWLATAGSGDALAGILGALVATNSTAPLAPLAATAALIHGRAGERAGGPFTILDLIAQVPATVRDLLNT
ncbi:MAG: NAD(P)H-hydrate dehydratase [Salinibacterium sp.]|nr:NAD(P)H-hydrate dehydratase [Salinibacterium sp.]